MRIRRARPLSPPLYAYVESPCNRHHKSSFPTFTYSKTKPSNMAPSLPLHPEVIPALPSLLPIIPMPPIHRLPPKHPERRPEPQNTSPCRAQHRLHVAFRSTADDLHIRYPMMVCSEREYHSQEEYGSLSRCAYGTADVVDRTVVCIYGEGVCWKRRAWRCEMLGGGICGRM